MTAVMSILVVSFDGYSDLWSPFFHCFSKYWPDCPYPVYLGCGDKKYEGSGVQQIFIGKDVDYSSNLLAMLRRIDSPWIVLWTDDFFLDSRVNTEMIRGLQFSLAAAPRELDVVYLDLLQFPLRISPLFSRPTKHDNIHEMPKGAPYRTSLGVTLWRRDFLERFLVPGESAWDIERKGFARADESSSTFWCVHTEHEKPPISIVNMVEKRSWTRRGANLLEREALAHHLPGRPMESSGRVFKMRIYAWARYLAVRSSIALLGTAITHRLLAPLVSARRLAIQN